MPRKLTAILVGMTIFVAIPLLMWGIGDLRGFMQNPARAAYLLITVLAQVLIITLVPNAGLSREEGTTVVARQRIAVLLLQLCTLGIVVIAPLTDGKGWGILGGNGVRYVGVVLYAAGLFVMNWAVIFLGRHFSVQVTLQKEHQLVTDGPYKFVRHPRYAGIWACFLGIALVFASMVALFAVTFLLLTILWRVRDEESLMATAFPVDWPTYARKTARLIPCIY